MRTSDVLWAVGRPSGVPVVPPYAPGWKNPEDLPSSRRCLSDVPRSSTPGGSLEPWPLWLLWCCLPRHKQRRHPRFLFM